MPLNIERKIALEAKKLSKDPQDLVREIIAKNLAHVVVPVVINAVRCLVPPCEALSFGRGLCTRHYRRVRYYVSKGLIFEGWLVRHGRMLPGRGLTTSDYAVEGETLETLPHDPPDVLAETTWLFGFPHAQSERARLKREASRA